MAIGQDRIGVSGPKRWRIITGEYPPQPGGVSDYTRLVACGLAAAGDDVEIFAPQCSDHEAGDPGVTIHRLPGHFGPRAIAALARALRRGDQARLLVQYVPHAFGLRAMNLPFCAWLYAHARRIGGADVMFHEVNFPFRPGHPARYRILAAATSAMAMMVARAARRTFVATPSWEPRLRRYLGPSTPISWLPVPSNIAPIGDRDRVIAARRRYAPNGELVIGHFGTYPANVAAMLTTLLPPILAARGDSTMLLMGTNSESWRGALIREYPGLAPRVVATGTLAADELSLALSSCDVMAQPFPDGITTRRGSIMAALAHGSAIVATAGELTEPLWAESGAIALAAVGDHQAFVTAVIDLMGDDARRLRHACAAHALYAERFALRHTIEALRAG
ncbi:MAG TPA: glycosyltransferase family 4 protein [Candidatus Binataceae bacterium]|nr:glycosyltransferase family 4 protein [Candidatus Binataceae bacterium]